MRLPLSVLSLAIVSPLLLPQAKATVEFLYAIKERVYAQSGDSQPSEPVEWSFGAGASGDGQLTAVSVTPLGAANPVPLVGDGGSYDLELDPYQNQAALDAAYPNGTVSFSITDNGASSSLGPFSITENAYPIVPHFTNAEALQSSDYSQDFEVTWNAFTGAGVEDQVLIQLWDNDTDTELIFDFLEASSTSYVIPGGTLVPDRTYDLDVIFINETDGRSSPETIIGYLSTTSFVLSTSTSDTALLFYKWKRREQTAVSTLQDPLYRPLATVRGSSRSVSSATLTSNFGQVQYPLSEAGPNDYVLVGPFGAKADMDSAYPSGEYSFGVTEDNVFRSYGSFFLTGDAYPDDPLLTNFGALQSFDATQAQTIDWGSVPSGVSLVQALVVNEANQQVWIESLDPSTTSVQLPANTLSQDTAYRLVVRFWAPATTNLKPPTALGYISSVVMDLQTSADGVGPGVSLAYIVKERKFLQEGNDQATTPVGWEFAAGVEGGLNVTGGSLAYPGGVEPLQGSDGEYDLGEKVYDDQASLDLAYPNTDYTLNVTIDGNNQNFGPLNLTGNGYPAAPHITNAVEFQESDHSQNFTVTWDAFSGADPDDRLIIELWNRTTDQDLVFEFLDVSSTSYGIPGGFLTEGNQYELTILFVNTTDSLETPETVVGYLSGTTVEVSTITSDTSLLFYKSRHNEQTGEGIVEEVGYQPLSIVSGLSNTVTDAALITPFGYIPLNPAGNLFIFVWPLDTKAALDGEIPVGEYRFDLTENGDPVSYGPYDLPGDAYPQAPLFQNLGELEVFDASQDRVISWETPPEDVTGITVQARTEGNAVAWTTNLAPSETSTTLPANTLLEVGNYNLLIHFWARKDGSMLPNANIGYRSSTFLPIQTLPSLSDFAAFKALFFTEGEILDPTVSGRDADPDGDGLSNYFEFLAQLDPTRTDSRMSYQFASEPSRKLSFSPLFGSANWAIETSVDLLNWATVSAQDYNVVGNDIQIDLEAFPSSSFFRVVLQPSP